MTKHQIDRCLRYSKEADDWRTSVFKRDDYTCQLCGIRGTYLEADHIKPWAYFPELRFELSNGRTLCKTCHNKTKMSAKKMKEIWALEK
jgi:5-methylcytosine-specific restriction endonuclease McrA